MNLFQTAVIRLYVRFYRSLGLLALWASVSAGAQTLNFATKEPVLPENVGLAVAATPGPMRLLTDETPTVELASAGVLELSGTSSSASAVENDPLPESPSATLASHSSFAPEPVFVDPGQFTLDPKNTAKTPDGRPIAPLYTKYIPAGWAYQPIHGREKFILGARDLYSPANIGAIFISAGWSHLVDGQPNYGVNSQAFAKRLGAIAIRETAQGIFTDGVFAVMFHQDPRYFAEGPKYNFMHRALYAATRPIIVRTTNGTGSTVNSSLLVGYAAAALLNNAYYPQINRNVKDNFTSYGTSIGGAALGFVASEFAEDALELLHLKRKP